MSYDLHNFTKGATLTATQLNEMDAQIKSNTDNLEEKEATIYTPELYGAVGDGVTDDSDALQACFNAHKEVTLKNSYKITRRITTQENSRITGNYYINDAYSDSTPSYEITGCGSIYLGKNSTISGVSFYNVSGTSQYLVGSILTDRAYSCGVEIVAGANTIENCCFNNCDYGIYWYPYNSNGQNTIDNNIFYYNKIVDIFMASNTESNTYTFKNSIIKNNIFNGNVYAISAGAGLENITIRNNHILSNNGILFQDANNTSEISHNFFERMIPDTAPNETNYYSMIAFTKYSSETKAKFISNTFEIIGSNNTTTNRIYAAAIRIPTSNTTTGGSLLVANNECNFTNISTNTEHNSYSFILAPLAIWDELSLSNNVVLPATETTYMINDPVESTTKNEIDTVEPIEEEDINNLTYTITIE